MSLGKISHLACRLALAATLVFSVPITFGEVTTEAQLKAAYLVNFLKYVEFPVPKTTVNLCLFGRDSLGPYLASYEGVRSAAANCTSAGSAARSN